MPEEVRDNVCIMCFLFKIHDTLEVGKVFGLVGCHSEMDINVFTSDPFVKVVFDLKEVLRDDRPLKWPSEIPQKIAYHHQHKSDGSHGKCIFLGKLRVYGTFVLFILEPGLIANSLYQKSTKYACF